MGEYIDYKVRLNSDMDDYFQDDATPYEYYAFKNVKRFVNSALEDAYSESEVNEDA